MFNKNFISEGIVLASSHLGIFHNMQYSELHKDHLQPFFPATNRKPKIDTSLSI